MVCLANSRKRQARPPVAEISKSHEIEKEDSLVKQKARMRRCEEDRR